MAQAIFQGLSDPGHPGFAGSLQHLEAMVGVDLLEDRSLRKFGWRIAAYFRIGRAVVEAPPLMSAAFSVMMRNRSSRLRGAAVRQVDPELLADDHQRQRHDQVQVGS